MSKVVNALENPQDPQDKKHLCKQNLNKVQVNTQDNEEAGRSQKTLFFAEISVKGRGALLFENVICFFIQINIFEKSQNSPNASMKPKKGDTHSDTYTK